MTVLRHSGLHTDDTVLSVGVVCLCLTGWS